MIGGTYGHYDVGSDPSSLLLISRHYRAQSGSSGFYKPHGRVRFTMLGLEDPNPRRRRRMLLCISAINTMHWFKYLSKTQNGSDVLENM